MLQFDEEQETFSLETISARLSERSQRILAEIGFGESVLEEDTAAGQALHCLRALEVKALSVQMDVLRRQIKEQEARGDIEGALRSADELNRLKKGHDRS